MPRTPLNQRKHGPTVAMWASFVEAEDHRAVQPNADLLEVVIR